MSKHLFRPLLLLFAFGLFSCKADVDLANVDPSIKVGFGAALPVGEMSARLGDFIQGDFGDILSVNEDGTLGLYQTVTMEDSIEDIDIASYFNPAHAELVIGNLIPEQLIAVAAMLGIPAHWKLGGRDEPIVLECPLGLSLGGINQPGSKERIDKAIINEAAFSARIQVSNLDMPFDKIESVELILDDHMHRDAGQIVLAQLDGKDYGKDVPVVIDNCVLDLVKDATQPLGEGNNIDSLTLTVRFTLSLEKTDTVTIQTDSKFEFDFNITNLDYAAIYGYFDASGLEVEEKMDINFSELIPIWDNIGSFKMPFANPRIDMSVTTNVGAMLAIHIDKISATDRKTGEKSSASFNGSPSTDFVFTNLIQPDDPLDAVVTNEFHLSKDPAEGHIDNLFTVEPQKLEFAYNAFIKKDASYPQMRLTKNPKVKVEAGMSLPFEFNQGLNLSLTDTLKVDIDKMSLDSLYKNAEVIDSIGVRVLRLIITAKNTMPFNIRLQFKALDENGGEAMEMQPLLIAAPKEWDAATATLVPGENQMVINITEDKLEKLSLVKTLLYTATLCDAQLPDMEGLNNVPAEAYPISISKDGQFSFKIGIAANLDAYLKLNF